MIRRAIIERARRADVKEVDFRPAAPAGAKLAKAGRDGLVVELEPTEDVLVALSAERSPDQTLVGFAAEHGAAALERASAKLRLKALDAIVVNDVSVPGIGFDAHENEVTIVTADSVAHVPRGPKPEVAAAIIDAVEAVRERAGSASASVERA